jgi:cytidylate kinase
MGGAERESAIMLTRPGEILLSIDSRRSLFMSASVDAFNSYLVSQIESLGKESPNDKYSANPFVTISSQTGAGCVTVSRDLCEYLQKSDRLLKCPVKMKCIWTVFDKELIDKIIEEHNLPKKVLPYLSENAVSYIQNMIEEMLELHPSLDSLVMKTNKTILHLAQLGYAVIVGRGANIITAKMPGGVDIRLVCPLERRLEHVQRQYEMTRDEAGKFILAEDGKRRDYVKKYFQKDVEDPLLYDMVINVDGLDSQETVSIIGDVVLNRLTLQAD